MEYFPIGALLIFKLTLPLLSVVFVYLVPLNVMDMLCPEIVLELLFLKIAYRYDPLTIILLLTVIWVSYHFRVKVNDLLHGA